MAERNYAVARTLLEQAQLLAGSTGFKRLQGEFGYAPVDAAPQRQRQTTQAPSTSMIIRPRGSDLQYAWDADLTRSALQKDHNPEHLASTIDYFVSMKHVAAARHGNGTLAQLRNAFRGDFKPNWMMTGTRAQYNPEGTQDVLIHNWRTVAREIRLGVNLTGADGWLADLPDAAQLTTAYFGTDDVRDVVAVIEAVSGKKPYVWRLNEKPKQTQERPVVLGLGGGGRFDVDAYYGVVGSSSRPARVVAVTQKISSGSKK